MMGMKHKREKRGEEKKKRIDHQTSEVDHRQEKKRELIMARLSTSL
jgi:hypothetical protein